MELITRAEAKAKGLKRYFTGKPCKRGHVAEGYVNGGCAACVITNNADRYKANPEKVKARKKVWRDATVEKRAAYQRTYIYGISPASFDKMMSDQGSKCGKCNKSISFTPVLGGGTVKAQVDHCHETGAVRGLLCGACNLGIGKLGDNLVGVLEAKAYLERFEPLRQKLATEQLLTRSRGLDPHISLKKDSI